MKILLGALLLLAFGLLVYRGMLARGGADIPQPRLRPWRCMFRIYPRYKRNVLVISWMRA